MRRRIRRGTIAILVGVALFWIGRLVPDSGPIAFLVGAITVALVAFRGPSEGTLRRGLALLALFVASAAALFVPPMPDALSVVGLAIAGALVVGATLLLNEAMRARALGLVSATNLCLMSFVALSLVIPPIFSFGYPVPGALEAASAFFRTKDAVAAAVLTVVPVLVVAEDLLW